ncbi:MAG: nucleotide excision repair endonuclease [Limisphaerales bacterium]
MTDRPGVYLMRDAKENILYIGKAKNLRKRLNNYRVANPDRMVRRHLRMLRQVARIELQECDNETTALAKEAELLRALKPKFNRAGVWPAKARYLVWQQSHEKFNFAVTETPEPSWNVYGPFGSSVIYLRISLLRLLWFALNPETGVRTIPEGWLHGRIGMVGSLSMVGKNGMGEVKQILIKLFEDGAEAFAVWIKERTEPILSAFDQQIVESDLESFAEFLKTKTLRTLSLAESSGHVVTDNLEHFENDVLFVPANRASR